MSHELNILQQRLTHLSSSVGRRALSTMKRGIEREALRIDGSAQIAQNSHPQALGSALTHPKITTDYSEALLEFITPVNEDIDALLDCLMTTHAYTMKHLDGQRLWPFSMPCYITEQTNIPIAQYGSSNSGKMKTLYRQGLTHRYGGLMQIISGVHFNFSVSDELWQLLYEQSDKSVALQDFKSAAYFGLIRNYRRLVWVLPYLFGASPALCPSFIKQGKSPYQFETSAKGTLYLPYATSLRMSDLGYTNNEQDALNISYNSLPEYLAGLSDAMLMHSDKFAQIGVKVDGEYRQLNSNILQIENEFYSPIRAKRVAKRGEKPSEALARGGVEYIEVRALDVNPFSPIGINAHQVRFLDLFLLYCLLSDSPDTADVEEAEITANLNAVVLTGRKPDLQLQRHGDDIAMQQWLNELFVDLGKIAELIDGEELAYAQALAHWQLAVDDPDKTLSGQVLNAILNDDDAHARWGVRLAEAYQQQLFEYPLTDAQIALFEKMATDSLAEQARLEAVQEQSFEHFLADYFNYAQ